MVYSTDQKQQISREWEFEKYLGKDIFQQSAIEKHDLFYIFKNTYFKGKILDKTLSESFSIQSTTLHMFRQHMKL